MGKYTRKKSSTSRYPERLAARGLSPTQVRMPFIDNKGRKYDTMEQLQRANSKRVVDGE